MRALTLALREVRLGPKTAAVLWSEGFYRSISKAVALRMSVTPRCNLRMTPVRAFSCAVGRRATAHRHDPAAVQSGAP
eukprot:1060334-Prymnesium_polylepis.1